MSKPSALTGRSTIATLVEHESLLDDLTGAELVVYLRLLAAAEKTGSRRLQIYDAQLHRKRGGRTAALALVRLSDRGLIKIKREDRVRTIEVQR